MITTDSIEDLICTHCIIKEFVELDSSILGYYYSDKNYNVILLNECIRANERLYRCVLCEELGHHLTTYGDITHHRHLCYRDRLFIDKKEMLALKCATDILIPSDILLGCFKTMPFNSILELSDHFLVTHDFMLRKFELMAKKNSQWELDSERYLYLGNFPNLHIIRIS